jgi:hypothetical protein
MTGRHRAVVYLIAATVGGAQYWLFGHFLRAESEAGPSLMPLLSVGFLTLGCMLVAFWLMAPLPKRSRWRRALRASVAIFGGIGGLLSETGFDTAVWFAFGAGAVAVILSFVAFRSESEPRPT